MLLPATGILLFHLFDINTADYLPALVLLCSPTATIVYVMAKEMDSDKDFTVATISVSTISSLVSYLFWLTLVSV